eukprot:CAMPEP_0115874306 /NCGR_PEP_ID=MMETSP0287-20121206/24467_1 /TAXON_ID=412157 /ORGANISM="Chrysochromulina rotalis, Strain UIO044" /LENGTH=67 /DNA_ID=CAMNT_0003329441 /DNA_START=291 /DNA_END=494 /DNA_ORIENTATION=+
MPFGTDGTRKTDRESIQPTTWPPLVADSMSVALPEWQSRALRDAQRIRPYQSEASLHASARVREESE